jgi:tetratricopeptide (TPR) repeat protein
MLKDALGAYRGTEKEISKMIDDEPGNAEAYYNRANVRSAGGDLQGASGDYTMALKLGLRFRESLTAYGNRGMICFQKGDYSGAIDDFNEIIVRRPNNRRLLKAALKQRALAKEKLGDLQGAAADRKMADLIAPDQNNKTQ